ncbi:amidohydrolase family protein [archaeon]|jgi:predicted TIM-barrel fold metal-dependent hydrolase|nr:amidohydrolase family protein [archaeon]MBT3450588.1 amidohydrolase family protein [archaeon]MBT6868442.1 amidohydrolase family protein [archaeon]MBT7193541.1 amidohydrolase family protein [archaeon]MBT7381264.1 amidohydrolase family protein [archaeon]
MKKIDIHCHTTNRRIKDTISGDASLEFILNDMGKYEIVNTNVLATYFPHKNSGISNYRMLNWINRYNKKEDQLNAQTKFTMFGSLDFEHYFYQGLNELEELASERLIKGIKIYTCYQEVDFESKRFEKILTLAREQDLPLMFHIGYSYSSMRKYGKVSIAKTVKPNDLEKTIKKNQDITFILSHLAKPFLSELIEVVNDNINVYSDMSGLLDSYFEQKEIPNSIEQIKRFVGRCGPSKLLFGTDFPVQTHYDSIFMIEEAMKNYSQKELKNVYYDNAQKILEGEK